MTGARGGCMCGAIRYEVAAEPLFTAICHCRQCQRQTGSAYSIVTGFPAEGVRVDGSTRTFDDVGESGKRVAKHFCPTCGSPIMSVLDALPGVAIIKSGTLDDFGSAKPTLEVFCDNAAGFLPAFAGTVRHQRSNLEGPA